MPFSIVYPNYTFAVFNISFIQVMALLAYRITPFSLEVTHQIGTDNKTRSSGVYTGRYNCTPHLEHRYHHSGRRAQHSHTQPLHSDNLEIQNKCEIYI